MATAFSTAGHGGHHEDCPTSSCQTERVARNPWKVIAIGATIGVVGTVVAMPTVVIADHLITQSIGRTTTVTDADGRDRTIYWREYPGVSGLEAEDVLDGPSVDEAYTMGSAMVAEMREALTQEFGLAWAPDPNRGDGNGPFFDRIPNGFGGESLLTTINTPTSQSTSIPSSWADKQRVIEIIGEVAAQYGFGPVVLDYERDAPLSDKELISSWGGSTPETMVTISGSLDGPTGQWLWFTLQDLSKDTDGTFAERLGPATENGWELNSVNLFYGANALLPDEHRAEFVRRLAPFEGLAPPSPLES